MVNSLPGSVQVKLVMGKYSSDAGINNFIFSTPSLNLYSFSEYFGMEGLNDSGTLTINFPLFCINQSVSPVSGPLTHVPYRAASSDPPFFLQAKDKKPRIEIINPAIADLITMLLLVTIQIEVTLHSW